MREGKWPGISESKEQHNDEFPGVFCFVLFWFWVLLLLLFASFIPELEPKKPATKKCQQAQTKTLNKSLLSLASGLGKGQLRKTQNFQTIITLFQKNHRPTLSRTSKDQSGSLELLPHQALRMCPNPPPHQPQLMFKKTKQRAEMSPPSTHGVMEATLGAVIRHPYPSEPGRCQWRPHGELELLHPASSNEEFPPPWVSKGARWEIWTSIPIWQQQNSTHLPLPEKFQKKPAKIEGLNKMQSLIT